jgi:type I restriction enzyme S subunit
MTADEPAPVVPNLRFPEFRTAGDWHFEPLGDIAEPISDRVGTTKCVPMSVTVGVGLVSQEEKFGRTIAGNSYRNYVRLQANDFAYNKSATKEFPQGYIARYSGTKDAAVPNSIFTCFRPDTAAVVPGYLDYLFHGNHHGRWLRKYITVGARAHGALSVSDDDLMLMPVPLPPVAVSRPEQQKIADCLGSLDDLIAAEGRKLEALREHKQGLMQQLFPQPGETVPRLRFPEFNNAGEWEEEKLNNLANRGSGHTPNKAKREYYNGGIKWVSLADSKRLDNGLISETAIEISEEGIKNSSAVLHPVGSVILSRDAGVGKSAIISSAMAVSQHFIAWTCKPTKLSNWFLYYQLQLLKPLFERIAMGSTIKTIGLPFFNAMLVLNCVEVRYFV